MDSPALPADRRPVPHRNIPYRNRSPAGNCGPAHCHRQVPVPGQFFPCFFPEFPEKSGRDRLAAHRPHSQPYRRFCPPQIWSGFMRCYQQVENRCFRQRRFIRADIPPGYTRSLCGRISSSVSGLQAGGIFTRIPRVNRRFRSPDRGIFDINQGGGGDAGRASCPPPEGAGAIDNRPLPRSGFSPARQSAAFSARGCSSAGYAPAGTGS